MSVTMTELFLISLVSWSVHKRILPMT